MRTPYLFFPLLLLLNCNPHRTESAYNGRESSSGAVHSYQEDQTAYRVTGIKDGDTFVLLMNGQEQTIRLAHIDCPEKNQPFGNKAKQFAAELCFGKYVRLIHNNKYDRNKRLIAEVLLPDGTNVNKEMVKRGLAWHFKKYSTSEEYAQLEVEARAATAGLWTDPNPIAPWDWRKAKE